jgi:hypothetical protein
MWRDNVERSKYPYPNDGFVGVVSSGDKCQRVCRGGVEQRGEGRGDQTQDPRG